eukprot:tig00021504_g21978.t1
MVFSTADATAGFWQLPLHPGSRAYTAFVHLLDLKALFETISKANLRLKPSKCRFCVPEIDLLGHRISAEGIRQDPAKTKVITDWQTPKNADELRSFLGLAGYYRRFVENFSKVTDASTYAIGAILSQADDKGVERPLAFISRTLLPAEMNYSATELECLAVVWAIKYWRHYLLGGPQFLAYDFEIVYRPGKQNGGPDACSRLPKDHPVWQPGGADGSSSKPAAYKGAEGFGIPQHAVGAEPEDPDVPLGIFRMQLGPTERPCASSPTPPASARKPQREEESRPLCQPVLLRPSPTPAPLKRPRPSLRASDDAAPLEPETVAAEAAAPQRW